jgi:hypothetical protein
MADEVPMEQLRERLWPAGDDASAYAILDGARDPRAHPIITGSKLEHRCLYIGELSPSLARAAPWIVRLSRDDDDTRELLRRGWGEAWGVYLRAPASSLAALHQHFRRILRVQDEAGRKLLFRYYDPRVLRAYLPTCTADELRQVFGPVERFFIEGERASTIGEYRFEHDALSQRETQVQRRLHWLGDYLRKSREEPQ